MTMIADKQGIFIDIHHRDGTFKISPFERDVIYQDFLRDFPNPENRRGILKEHIDKETLKRAKQWFKGRAERMDGRVTAQRIYHFVSEALAAQEGLLPASERWDWWVGCSLANRA